MVLGALARFGFVLAAGLLAGPAAAGESKVFRDWTAGCDNLRQCTALSLPGEADERIAFLKLERPGGPAGEPVLSLNLRDQKLPRAFEARLTLDDAPFPAAGQQFPGSSVDQETGTIAIPAREAQALLAAARKATKLGLRIGDRSFAVSLAGAVAALLFIDEQQGRLGTTTALIRQGDKPASAVPAAPALPVVTSRATASLPALGDKAAKALAGELRAHLKRAAPDSCEDIEEGSSISDSVWALAPNRFLVGLVCYRGAYNMGSFYWLVEPGKVAATRRVTFPTPSGKPQEDLVNSSYDPASGQLDFFSKGRGLGDCGSSGIYAWSGTGFALVSWNEMSTCRGLPADEWISLFRSEVKVVK